jgi:predicted CXXCH cytochrome family protein
MRDQRALLRLAPKRVLSLPLGVARHRTPARARLLAAVALFTLLVASAPADDEAGKIMRPVDGAAFEAGPVDVIATAPAGKLELDGKPLTVEQPFPNVFHGIVPAMPGLHTLAVVWAGGRAQIRFFVGPHPPANFKPFHQHPPIEGVPCTQCHEISRHGRFRFKGGCFDCHQQETFAKIHTHDAGRLAQCGMCHNAHGSTDKANLIYPKDVACKLCHN